MLTCTNFVLLKVAGKVTQTVDIETLEHKSFDLAYIPSILVFGW